MQAAIVTMAQQIPNDDRAHLDAEQILELVEQGRQHTRYDEYIDHVVECAVCRETYKQLLQAESAGRAARRQRTVIALRFLLPAAAAAMLILFFGARALLNDGVETAGLRQQDGVWYEGATRLPDWAFAAAMQFERPPAPTRDAPSETPRAVRLIRPNPANAAVDTLTPEFQWAPLPDAVRYRVRLERADGSRALNLKVDGERATLPEGERLEASVSYRLTIEASAADELAGDGLKTVYEFRTLTPDEQQRLRWARENRTQVPRACAVIFYRLGFYADALEMLEQLPNEPIVQQWREVIQSSITSATVE